MNTFGTEMALLMKGHVSSSDWAVVVYVFQQSLGTSGLLLEQFPVPTLIPNDPRFNLQIETSFVQQDTA